MSCGLLHGISRLRLRIGAREQVERIEWLGNDTNVDSSGDDGHFSLSERGKSPRKVRC